MGDTDSKPTLSEEDLEFLTRHTNFTKEGIADWYKGFMEDCPDGHLTKEKFIELYKLFLKKGNPDTYCEHVFRTFDTNSNGFIEFKEFCLAIGMLTNGTSCEKLSWAFRMYDINDDGAIEKSEMLKLMKALYELVGATAEDPVLRDTPEERTERIFSKVDLNDDGRISKGEFLRGCLDDPDIARLLRVK